MGKQALGWHESSWDREQLFCRQDGNSFRRLTGKTGMVEPVIFRSFHNTESARQHCNPPGISSLRRRVKCYGWKQVCMDWRRPPCCLAGKAWTRHATLLLALAPSALRASLLLTRRLICSSSVGGSRWTTSSSIPCRDKSVPRVKRRGEPLISPTKIAAVPEKPVSADIARSFLAGSLRLRG